MEEVRHRRKGTSCLTVKHQITIPVEAVRAAGLQAGDRLAARVEGPGRVVLEREDDVLAELAGSLTGLYRRDELAELRAEWG